MKRTKKTYTLLIIITIIVGSLLHFVYEWSGQNKLVAVFGAVNESTWEHLKMLFWPMLIISFIEYFIYGKEYKNFIPVKALSIIIGIATIIISFYTYTGILGEHYLLLDILTFIAGVIAAYVFSYRQLVSQEKYTSKTAQILGIVGIVVLILLFVLFTFNPPQIGLYMIK